MKPKYQKGDRVIWTTGAGMPHGKITDEPLEPGATKVSTCSVGVFNSYAYIVSLDNQDAKIIGEEVLKPEELSKRYCPCCGSRLYNNDGC